METPGMILKREREVQGFSLKQIAAVTRIPETSLEAIENNNFEAFAAEVFAKGFVRNYARELQISTDDIIAAYDAMKLQKSRLSTENIAVQVSEPAVINTYHEETVSSTFSETEHVSATAEQGRHGFKLAYVLVALVAVASIALSISFSGTGEADEADIFAPSENQAVEDSPFLISNTSEGWESP